MRKAIRPIPVSKLMKKDVGIVAPKTSLRTAAQLMWAKRATCVVVEKGNVPVGIISLTDILHAVAENQDMDVVTCDSMMSEPIIFISPDTNIDWAAELMANLHISKLPVIENNRLLGILTEKEITNLLPEIVEMSAPIKTQTEHAFLVRHDGKLLANVSRTKSEIDEDIIASMLTALEHFVEHSLTGKDRGRFEELHYGNLKIVLRHGSGILFAVFITGEVSDALLSIMDDVVNYVEAKYGDMLQAWDGDWTHLGDLQTEIKGLMKI